MLRYVCVLKLEKSGPTFSSFHAIPAKMTKQLLYLELPDEICFMSSSQLYKSSLFVGKGAK